MDVVLKWMNIWTNLCKVERNSGGQIQNYQIRSGGFFPWRKDVHFYPESPASSPQPAVAAAKRAWRRATESPHKPIDHPWLYDTYCSSPTNHKDNGN
jgi:hypothetical protein